MPQYLPTILNLTLILITTYSHVHHECNHDHHIKDIKIRETVQKYNNHPLDKSIPSSTRRQLIATESNTKPIRIRPYYDPNTISTSFLTSTEITYIKQLVSVTVKYYEKFINVIPISGSLQLQRDCRTYIPTSFGDNCLSYYEANTCGNVNVPSDHFGPDFRYRYNGANNTAYYDTSNSGNGVDDADLIIYVSYGDTDSCGGNTLAYAETCYSDQYGRPVGGAINFCSIMFDGDETWRKDAITTLHEITHVMIMSQSLWSKFKDSNGDTIENVLKTYNNQQYIVTPKVKDYAQDFYGCDDDDLLPGLPLEDNGGSGSAGSHWEEKYLNSDYMGSTIYSAQTYVGEATLKLMEDSGWYYVDYDYADPFYWGKNEGCDFFEKDCIGGNGIVDTSTFPQYFCESYNDGGCTYDHASRGSCQIYTYSSSLPSNMQWFSDSRTGGPQNSAFCPFRNAYTYRNAPDDFEGECKDSRGNNYISNGGYESSIFGLDSRCVDWNSGGYDTGKCFRHICYGYDSDLGQWDGVKIEIDSNEQIDCERDDAYTSKASTEFSGVTIKCPNIDTICGESSEPFKCKYGNWNDDMNECICNPGYKGDICSTEDKSITSEATIAKTANAINYPDGMVDDEPTANSEKYKVCLSEMKYWYLDGTYTFYKMHNWKPSYTVRNGGHDFYLFWDIFDKQWEISMSISTGGPYAKCQTDDKWNSDLETCNGLWGNIGKAKYGACADPIRENPEIEDENGLNTDPANVGVDGKNKKLNWMNVEYMIIGGCLLFAVLFTCCFGIFWYKKRNKRLAKEIVNDEEVGDVSVIQEEDVEQDVTTNTISETETNVGLR